MFHEVECECLCLTTASVGRCFFIVCGTPLHFADNKSCFGGFCLNSTFKNRIGFPKIT